MVVSGLKVWFHFPLFQGVSALGFASCNNPETAVSYNTLSLVVNDLLCGFHSLIADTTLVLNLFEV